MFADGHLKGARWLLKVLSGKLSTERILVIEEKDVQSHVVAKASSMLIKVDDLQGPEIAALLSEHLADMFATSPAESVHALDLAKLRQPEITFWTVWDSHALAGCGALKQLNKWEGEVKSMRTVPAYRRKGVAAYLLQHLIAEAKQRGYRRLNLETGSMEYFAAARELYRRFGFTECAPFADYREDPYSVFMTMLL